MIKIKFVVIFTSGINLLLKLTIHKNLPKTNFFYFYINNVILYLLFVTFKEL